MNYSMRDSEEDLGVLVEKLTKENHEEDKHICNNDQFQVEYILRPVAETTLREFIDKCIRNVSNFPEDWSLCTKDGSFNCDPITGYVQTCEKWRAKTCHFDQETPNEPCNMGMVMSQSSGLLILFALVIIGVLIGISVTVAVCLICPQMHRWANKKIRGDNYAEKSKSHPASVFHLEALDSQTSSNGLYEARSNQMYTDSQIPSASNGESDSVNEYTYIGGVGRARVSEAESITDYEGLTRNNSQQQSHKYAHLPQNVPEEGNATNTNTDTDSPEYAHNYFVLEKKNDK